MSKVIKPHPITRLFITGKASTARLLARALEKKPNEAERLEDHFRINDDVVTWVGGHLFRLAAPEEYDARFRQWHLEDLPILPAAADDETQPRHWIWQKVSNREDLVRQLNFLQQALAQVQVAVIHAGDPDREGQWLIDQVLDQLGYQGPVYRLHLYSQQYLAIKSALDLFSGQPVENKLFKPLSISAQARACADWLYGMNMTRAYTLLGRHGGHQEVLSVGRVQTPLLALVVQRDEAIERFKPEPLYHLRVKFSKVNIYCLASMDIDEEQAEGIEKRLQGSKAWVRERAIQHHVQNPPLPLNLACLQIECAKRFGYSAMEVMEAAKNLYEHHLITYPRSECRYLPDRLKEQAEEVVDTVLKNLPDFFDDISNHFNQLSSWRHSACWDSKKVGVNHAIIPTAHPLGAAHLTNVEQGVYSLICGFYVAQFLTDYQYEEEIIRLDCNGFLFSIESSKITQSGWKTVLNDPAVETEIKHKPDFIMLPSWEEGVDVLCENVEVRPGKTRPPHRFTDTELMEAMAHIRPFIEDETVRQGFHHDDGLGTESSRAYMIDTLFQRSYLIKGNKIIYSTALGRDLIHALPAEAVKVEMTAKWEKKLADISKMALDDAEREAGIFLQEVAESVRNFIIPLKGKKNIHLTLADEVLGLKTMVKHCPWCESVLRQREGKYGQFWGCSAYPQCKYTQKI